MRLILNALLLCTLSYRHSPAWPGYRTRLWDAVNLAVLPEAAEGPSPLLTMPFPALSNLLGGSGKAKIVWKNLREALDPLGTPSPGSGECTLEVSE